MTQERAAEILEQMKVFIQPEKKTKSHIIDAIDKAIDALKAAPAWVRTADRKPDSPYDVIAVMKTNRGDHIGEFSANDVFFNPKAFPYWMPLPPLPTSTPETMPTDTAEDVTCQKQ